MISKEALKNMKFLSLKERVIYLWDNHNIHISVSALRQTYLRYGIYNLKAKNMKKNLMLEQDRYFIERAEAAKDLLSLIYNREPVCYVDETTVAINNMKRKTW